MFSESVMAGVELFDCKDHGSRLLGRSTSLQILTEQTGGRLFRVGKKQKQTLTSIFDQIEEEIAE
jgi:hypothetical protein